MKQERLAPGQDAVDHHHDLLDHLQEQLLHTEASSEGSRRGEVERDDSEINLETERYSWFLGHTLRTTNLRKTKISASSPSQDHFRVRSRE